MKFLSVCSGIEAASVAWEPLGWTPVLYSEIEKFPRAVLADRQRAIDAKISGAARDGVPLWGDFTAIRTRHFDRLGIDLPDVLVGGTPCQAFSVAGMRRSLDDARGNLTLSFVRLANAIDNERKRKNAPPLVVTWENVPGVLSTKDNAFGCFLGALAGADSPLVPPKGGKWKNAGLVNGPRRSIAWRVLDAQHFGVPQRRRRVFVVASARNFFDPGAVLFESFGVRGDSPPSREKRETAPTIPSRSTGGGGLGTDFDLDGGLIAHPVTSRPYSDRGAGDLNILCMATGQGGAEIVKDGSPSLTCNHEAPIVVGEKDVIYGIPGNWIGRKPENGGNATEPMVNISPCLTGTDKHAIAHTLRGESFDASEDGTGRGTPLVPVSFHCQQDPITGDDVSLPIGTGGGTGQASIGVMTTVVMRHAVRRLIPRECERLQGFPDDYTLIPWRKKSREDCPDGPRYKAIGNSMAVPVMHWIGARIQMIVDYFGGEK